LATPAAGGPETAADLRTPRWQRKWWQTRRSSSSRPSPVPHVG